MLAIFAVFTVGCGDSSESKGGDPAVPDFEVEFNVLEMPTCAPGTFALNHHVGDGVRTTIFNLKDVTATDDSLDAQLDGGGEVHLKWEPAVFNKEDGDMATGWLRLVGVPGFDSEVWCVDQVSRIQVSGTSASIDFGLSEGACYEPPETPEGELPPGPPPAPAVTNVLGCFSH